MIRVVWIAALLAVVSSLAMAQDNWPQFRGPDQNSIGTSTGLPVTWSETENIVWKTKLPSWSAASPAIWGDRIFLMSPSGPDNPGAEVELDGPGGTQLLLLCLNKADGAILWERPLDTENRYFQKGNDASPSPVTDGTTVWAVTGTGLVYAFDFDGNQRWKKNLPEDYGKFGHKFGYSSSPTLFEGNLIIEVLHGYNTDDPSYLLALESMTGKEVWRQTRPTEAISESPDGYTTPTVFPNNGAPRILVLGGDCVTGHDAHTGQELWRVNGLNPKNLDVFRLIASPVAVDGMIYVTGRRGPVFAIKAGGEGDLTATNIVWKWEDAHAPDVPTPICDGKYFYMVDDIGVVYCLDAKTGGVIWGPEHTARGALSASPILGDGHLYVTNEAGVTSVLAAAPEFKLEATNTLEAKKVLSTFAVSGNRLYLRTDSHLYCIGQK